MENKAKQIEVQKGNQGKEAPYSLFYFRDAIQATRGDGLAVDQILSNPGTVARLGSPIKF